jgi:hypothetical protein
MYYIISQSTSGIIILTYGCAWKYPLDNLVGAEICSVANLIRGFKSTLVLLPKSLYTEKLGVFRFSVGQG